MLLPPAAYVPGLQVVQGPIAATDTEYVPASHAVHVPTPAAACNLPGSQLAHVLFPPAAYVCDVQFMQGPIAPTETECVPVSHAVHVLPPAAAWNLQGSQLAQGDTLSGPAVPAVHEACAHLCSVSCPL